MGNTTVIELDHDLALEIAMNKEEFVDQILSQLSCFAYSSPSMHQYFGSNRIHGGHVIAGFHRSGFIEETWNKCKRMMAEAVKGRNNH